MSTVRPLDADVVRAALGWSGEVEVLRAGSRPVQRVVGSGVVKAFAAAEAAEAGRQAAVARALADAGVPVVRPLSTPVQAGAWMLLPLPDLPHPLPGEARAWRGFGAALGALHRSGGAVGIEVSRWQPLAQLETWLATASDTGLATEVRGRAQGLAASLPDGDDLLHTDPHAGNVRVDADGRVVLIDLDGLARGDGRYDLGVIEATERRHHGRTHTLPWLLQGYGPTDRSAAGVDQVVRTAADLREVLSIGWLVGLAVAEPAALELARTRLADLIAGRGCVWGGL